MTDAKDPKLALFELYLSTAEKVSDRRAQGNAWMLSVNSAIVAIYGYLEKVSMPGKSEWLWAIPVAGIIVCFGWRTLLTSYRQLNQAKVKVLMQLEADLPSQPFAREHEIYRSEKRKSLSWIEALIPVGFGFVYLVMFLVAVFPPAVTFFKAMEDSGEGSPVPCFFPCLRL